MAEDKAPKGPQTFSFDVTACILAFLSQNGGSIGNKEHEILSKIDGTKTASGFQHMLRDVKKRAVEINERITNGEFGNMPATPAKKKGAAGSKASTPVTGEKSGKKRPRKGKAATDADPDDEEDDGTAVKKVKKIKKEDRDHEEDGLGDALGD